MTSDNLSGACIHSSVLFCVQTVGCCVSLSCNIHALILWTFSEAHSGVSHHEFQGLFEDFCFVYDPAHSSMLELNNHRLYNGVGPCLALIRVFFFFCRGVMLISVLV